MKIECISDILSETIGLPADKYVRINDGFICLSINQNPNNTYDIDLARVKSPHDVVNWIHHLSEKWFDIHGDYDRLDVIDRFAEKVYKFKGWDIYKDHWTVE